MFPSYVNIPKYPLSVAPQAISVAEKPSVAKKLAELLSGGHANRVLFDFADDVGRFFSACSIFRCSHRLPNAR